MFKYIAAGILISFIITLIVYLRRGYPENSRVIVLSPLIIIACIIWSVLPGFIKILQSNFYISNIFFFYGVMHDFKRGGTIIGLAVILSVFFSFILILIHHLKIQEAEIEELKKDI